MVFREVNIWFSITCVATFIDLMGLHQSKHGASGMEHEEVPSSCYQKRMAIR